MAATASTPVYTSRQLIHTDVKSVSNAFILVLVDYFSLP